MTKTVNIAEAKAKLSALVDRAAAGEEITLCRSGRPVARLVPLLGGLPREPGVRRAWKVPDELFLEPADEADLAAAEGAHTDALGLSRRRR
jgi:prevent-host-death family protein